MIAASIAIAVAAAASRGAIDSAAFAASLRAAVIAERHDVMRWGDTRDVQPALLAAYQRNQWRPLWVSSQGTGEVADAAIAHLTGAQRAGLDAVDYDAPWLASRAHELDAVSVSDRAEFDVVLSAAVLRFAQALHRGRVDPRQWYPELAQRRDSLDAVVTLLALASPESSNREWNDIEPQDAGYRALIRALTKFRAIEADSTGPLHAPMPWPGLLHPGSPYRDAPRLRQLLGILGAHPGQASASDTVRFDGSLALAIERFQRHQALPVTGIPDQVTWNLLQVPITRRIRQIELNLERRRWSPAIDAPLAIEVNVPAQELEVVDRTGDTAISRLVMKVIVGRSPAHRTPWLSTVATAIEVAPPWLVPPSIARAELRPRFRRTPAAIAQEGFELLRGASVVPVTLANIQRIGDGVDLRQRPGPLNPLGHLKLAMPNPANIYLHDTPDRALFDRALRTFSHGCVRVADARALAELLLGAREVATDPTLTEALADDETRFLPLATPVPVVIRYFTVVAGADGTPIFYRDIYGSDGDVDAALRAGYPRPVAP